MSITLSKTYREAAEDFIMNDAPAGEQVQEGIFAFAKHLDSFSTLDDKLQMLAMHKAREIDREVLLSLAAEIPTGRVEEIVKEIYSKHKHTEKSDGKLESES